jgi:protoheme IX farnesyltransferase
MTDSPERTMRSDAALPAARPAWLRYAELTKPGLTSLVLVTTAFAYLLASRGPVDWLRLFEAVLGTALIGGGANGLNQWWEVERDRRMKRTRDRPLPSRRLSPRRGLVFSVTITILGTGLLLVRVHPLAAGLALASWGIYIFVYTPLKLRTTLNTVVGAVSGALPPLVGWAAAAGRLDAGAWVLFAILFIWQIPHFLAIAWVHREDYVEGGFRMLPVVEGVGRAPFRIVVVYCLGLLPVAAAAAFVDLAGWVYLVGSVVLGSVLLGAGLRLYRDQTPEAARRLFLASIAYLPALFLLMVLDPTRLRT